MSNKNNVIDLEGAVAEPKCPKLLERVGEYLAEKDWTYTLFDEDEYLAFNLRLRDGSARVFVQAWEGVGWSRLVVYVTYPTFVPLPRRSAVCEAITRINQTNILGNFELDMNDGEVRVRTTLESDLYIGEPMIDRAIRKGLDLADQYQAALLAIAFGNASAQDVLEMGARDETETVQ